MDTGKQINTMRANNQNITISGSTLKFIAIFTMLIDHTAYVFVTENNYLYLTMRLIGRIAFPIFVFLLIEGVLHTRNKIHYALRLTLFAFLSEIPFDLAFHKNIFFFGYQNVFFTLAIGVFMILAMETISTKELHKSFQYLLSFLGFLAPTTFITLLYGQAILSQFRILFPNASLEDTVIYFIIILISLFFTGLYLFSKKRNRNSLAMFYASSNLLLLILAIFLSYLLKTDYSIMGILAIYIMFRLKERKTIAFFFACLLLIFFQPFELPALLGLLPISKYRGERGLRLKYFFYIFYPSHLLLLYIISYFMH